MNKWFKKFPYHGWATIFFVALIGFVMTYRWEKAQYTPRELTAAVQENFREQEQRVFQDQATANPVQSSEHTTGADPYSRFTVENGKAISWNIITTDLPDSVLQEPEVYINGKLMLLANGYYYLRVFPVHGKPGRYNFTLIPIVYHYPVDNEFFHSRFVAGPQVPVSTLIDTIAQPGAYPVYGREGKPAFYLQYTQTADELYKPGAWVWLLCIVATLGMVFWVHEFCYGVGLRYRNPLMGWFCLVFFLGIITFLRSRFSFPVGFLNSKLFSPELFSSEGIKSLGDFLLTVMSVLWCLFYLIVYVPLADISIFKKRWAAIGVRIVACCALNWYIFHGISVYIGKLINDSKISFEAGNFYGLDIFSFLGIFCLCALSINFLLILGIINSLLQTFLPRNLMRYGVFLMICGLSLLSPASGVRTFDLIMLLMAVAGLLLIESFGLPLQKPPKLKDISVATATYIWFAILCSWITLEIFYFNYSKEQNLRQSYAQKQEEQDDGLMEFDFETITQKLEQDTTVKFFLNNSNSEVPDKVSQYIVYNYLSDYEYSTKYTHNIYYYDRNHHPLQPKDSTDVLLQAFADSAGNGTFVTGLTNVAHAKNGSHIYWFLSPVREGRDTLGYIGIDLAANKNPEMKKRSFLEKKNNPTDQQYYDHYSFAVYRNNVLWSQGGSGSEVFPYICNNGNQKDEFTFIDEKWRSSTLLYRVSDNVLIKVVYKRPLIINIISIFSLVLAMLLGLAAVIFLIRQLMFYPGKLRFFLTNFNFTIRSKVNITILVTVFASLLVVGVITLSFLNLNYKERQQKDLQGLLLYYAQSILRLSEQQHYNLATPSPGISFAYSDLSYKLKSLAEENGKDINLYNRHGKLIATSQLPLLKKGLISKHMQWDVFLSLRHGDQSELIKEDKIGDLNYQSVYAPVRDKDDNVLAYINLPYYASASDRNNEISSLLVTLINVYTLVFFLSGIFAIFISNSIIRSFRLLINQFRNIRLRHNEYIEWPYKDEIGVLVKEYNAMMRKVEAMAARLARTEREEAWREIAKQVAHEIKNPLTPMKLNIQYLQQAILNERPDIDKLAMRVSETLVEQIENLNLIATEFSNFAKMPEARPEPLNLHQNLQSLVSLFQKDSKAKVWLQPDKEDLIILMDKSYFMRVFTNLMQNAIQAIDHAIEGKVTVSYEQKEDTVVIKIKDNGTGIPLEMQEKLFVPYFTTKSSGTGLGLSMTKNMVENSNGMIWFQSVEKEGSEFFVQLPIYRSETHDRKQGLKSD